jgi:hypothetical protein
MEMVLHDSVQLKHDPQRQAVKMLQSVRHWDFDNMLVMHKIRHLIVQASMILNS